MFKWLSKADDDTISHWARNISDARDESSLGVLLEFYLLHASRKQAHISPRTLLAYRTGLSAFLIWCEAEDVNISQPMRRDLARYRLHLENRPNRGRRGGSHLAPSTVGAYLTTVRLLYRALHWADVIQGPFPEDVRSPIDPTRSAVKNPPYDQEVERALELATPGIRALLLLCAHGGLRISEALMARRSHLHGAVLLVKGKGEKTRQVPLSARTREALLTLPAPAGQDAYFDWTYNQAYYRVQNLFRDAQVEWRGFHAARKAAASRLYHQTRDFTRVAIFLGHSSVDTTRRYVRMDEDDVAAEVEQW
ncbi:integrase [Deinococcus aerolatus]|uniref:Integrase n=1 Tax=Deinococcus aerolatus TaxID=522487 RepID=A0ABQ2GDA0_9DEIO|nr:tyrosine-type recombinase/integrase [Deinococcus aerolatus]GGL88377.1 integrase [Deinococcus aerolatus]